MDFISKNYSKIKGKFKIKITRFGLKFDEDIFSDTIIKCNNTLKERELSDKEMISYFWCAFKTNTLRDLNYARNNTTNEYPTNLVEEYDEVNDCFENVSKMIIDVFGEELYKLFVLHANGTPYSELDKITDIKNLKYTFRKIREYVRANYKNMA